jgi:cysteine desulfurase / selenocysteine lyase
LADGHSGATGWQPSAINKEMIYLDHAATSWPKPAEVMRAMAEFLKKAGGNPGRSGHRLSIQAGRVVYNAREAIAELFHAPDPLKVIFTLNGTHAINLALSGLLRAGDHVVTSGIEHNAVMRPLRALEKKGVLVAIVPCAPDGSLDPADVERAMKPNTRLVAVNHASNVTGTLLPVAQIAQSVRRAGSLLLVDAAQTAGTLPIDIQAQGIDLLAFTGHKGLLGPPGVGGLVLGDRLNAGELEPLVRGGTGSRSESDIQPEDLPDKFESGTLNGVGIAGLGAGVRILNEQGIEGIRAREIGLTRVLIEGLKEIPGVTVYGPVDLRGRTAVVSITVAGRRVSDIGMQLDEQFGILCRVGLHCAPAAHRTIGTLPEGTVRLAPGFSSKEHDIHAALRALKRIVAKSP